MAGLDMACLGAKGPVQLLHDLIGAMAAISEVDNKVPDTGHDEGRKKREKLERVAKVFFFRCLFEVEKVIKIS